MGCASSNVMDDNLVVFTRKSTNELLSHKNHFLAKQKTISDLILNNKVFDDDFAYFYSLDHDKFEDAVDTFWNKNKALFDEKLFNKESFKQYALTVASQSYIMKNLFYKEYNLSELVMEAVKELSNQADYSATDLTVWEDVLKNTAEKFPSRQKGFVYFPAHIKSYCFSYGHINNNFKYNCDFEINAFNFVLIEEHIDNIGYLKGIAEIIEANSNLVSVCMQLYDYYDDNKPFDKSIMKNINIILDAIKNNTNIKALAILQARGGEDSLDLGDEVFNKIDEVMKKDFLYFVYFFRLSFNSEFGKKIGSTIRSLNNLKFFGSFSNDRDFSYLNDIFQGVSRNNSLNIIIIQKYDIPESVINDSS